MKTIKISNFMVNAFLCRSHNLYIFNLPICQDVVQHQDVVGQMNNSGDRTSAIHGERRKIHAVQLAKQ